MIKRLLLPLLLIACSGGAWGQVAPSAYNAVGGLPAIGSLHYNLNYGQTSNLSKLQGDQIQSIVSADASFSSIGSRHPFSLTYAGGYDLPVEGSSDGEGIFQHLAIQQVAQLRHWNMAASDDVSLSRQTPITGFSGVPGAGDVGGVTSPITGTASTSNASILTTNTPTVQNATTVSVGHPLNHATSVSVGGSWDTLRFLRGIGQDTDQYGANLSLTRRLTPRNSLAAIYSYTRFVYDGTSFDTLSQTAMVSFQRRWTRKINYSLSAGPQWTKSSNNAFMPSSLQVSINAAINEKFKIGSGGLGYSRATTSGSGYLQGAQSDDLTANLGRTVGRRLNVGLTASYMRSSGLLGNGITYGKVASGQISRKMGRDFSFYASYSAISQSSSSNLPSNAVSGLMQVVGFGIECTPRDKHLM
jgi:hypothetical protein